MAFPDTDLLNQWVDPEFLGAVKMNARIDQMLNLLAQRIRAQGATQLMAAQTSAQTGWINVGLFVPVTNMVASLDPAGAFASNVWTVPVGGTGLYDVDGCVALATGGTGRARTGVGISINGSLTVAPGVISAAVSGTASCAVLPPVGLSLTAGQTVGLLAFHDATTAIGTVVSGTSFYSFLRITRVS